MKRIKLGDIFEIKTANGYAYLHFVFKDEKVGELIRVLPGVYQERPHNVSELAMKGERYMVYFPVSAALRKKIIELVSFYQADDFTKPKLMRMEHWVRGEFLGWFIVDTNTWKMNLVKTLTNEQKKLSPWGIVNDTLLIERINENWSLDNWS